MGLKTFFPPTRVTIMHIDMPKVKPRLVQLQQFVIYTQDETDRKWEFKLLKGKMSNGIMPWLTRNVYP